MVALCIVGHLVVDATNLDLNDEKDQMKLFWCLLSDVKRWYTEKYGEGSLENPSTLPKPSFVLLRDSPIGISIPMKLSKPDATPHQRWLLFPDSATRGEPVFDYLSDRKVIEALTQGETKRLKTRIRKKGSAYRRIHKNLMMADAAKVRPKMAQDIQTHLSLGVECFMNTYHQGVSVAIWEWFFSVELAVKLLHFDTHGREIQGHVLSRIIACLGPDAQTDLSSDPFLKAFPTQDAISYRYSNLVERDLRLADRYFDLTLRFLIRITHMRPPAVKSANGPGPDLPTG